MLHRHIHTHIHAHTYIRSSRVLKSIFKAKIDKVKVISVL
jgi:hypothetical protein